MDTEKKSVGFWWFSLGKTHRQYEKIFLKIISIITLDNKPFSGVAGVFPRCADSENLIFTGFEWISGVGAPFSSSEIHFPTIWSPTKTHPIFSIFFKQKFRISSLGINYTGGVLESLGHPNGRSDFFVTLFPRGSPPPAWRAWQLRIISKHL